MCASRAQISLNNVLWHRPDDTEYLLVMVSQSRLRVCVWRRQARDITVSPLAARVETRRALDVGVRSCWPCAVAIPSPQILLQDEGAQALSGLCNARRSAHRCCNAGCAFGMGKSRCGGAAVVLSRHDGGFFPGGIGDDLLDVLVATLRGLPMWVSERFRDLINVELI